jgi:mannosyltransferase
VLGVGYNRALFKSKKRLSNRLVKEADETLSPVTSARNVASATTRGGLLTIGAITLLAILARLLCLSKSLRLDEASSVEIVRGIFLGGQAPDTWASFGRVLWSRELNMAFYYFLLRLWMKLGTNVPYLRLLSVIPGVCTIPLLYVLGRRMFDRRVALVAALLLSLHSAHVGFSQEMRAYPLFVFLVCLSYFLFLKAIETPSFTYWALYALTSAVAVYTHFFALLVIPAQYVSLLCLPRRASPPWRGLLASAAAVTAFAIPVVVFVLTKDTDQLSWITSTWAGLPKLISLLAGNPASVPVYVILWYVAIRHRTRGRSESSLSTWHQALVITWLGVPIALVLVFGLFRPILATRYLLFCVPASVLLAAQGLVNLPGPRRRVLMCATLVLALAGVVYAYYTPREDWQAAARYVLSQSRPGDMVTVVPTWTRHPFEYYWSRWAPPGVARYYPEQPAERAAWLESISGSHNRLWLLVSMGSKDARNSTEVAGMRTALAALQYHVQASRDFDQVIVETYEKAPPTQPGER